MPCLLQFSDRQEYEIHMANKDRARLKKQMDKKESVVLLP